MQHKDAGFFFNGLIYCSSRFVYLRFLDRGLRTCSLVARKSGLGGGQYLHWTKTLFSTFGRHEKRPMVNNCFYHITYTGTCTCFTFWNYAFFDDYSVCTSALSLFTWVNLYHLNFPSSMVRVSMLLKKLRYWVFAVLI